MPLSRMRSQKGFTLVELLIVVAIIGILSTVGVPTFRKMVQKAKKTEAKVNLGGLFTSESAFFSEYGGYGNNLNGVGYEIDGTVSIYKIGFMTTGAGDAVTVRLPTAASGIGIGLNNAFGGYYTETAAFCLGNIGVTSPIGFDVGDIEGSTFVAGAAGPIAPGVTLAIPGGLDVWQIDQRRRLANIQDGVGRTASSTATATAAPTGTTSP